MLFMIPVHFHRYNYHILCSEFLSRLCKKFPVQNRTFLIRFQISDHFVSDHFLYVLSYSMVTKPKIPVEILVRPSKEKKKKSINQSCQFSINHSQNCIYLFFFFFSPVFLALFFLILCLSISFFHNHSACIYHH